MALSTYESADQYYKKLILDISPNDLVEWEDAIRNAERTRLKDVSVMDILGSQHPTIPESEIPSESDINGSASEWIRMALDIEEKQSVIFHYIYPYKNPK